MMSDAVKVEGTDNEEQIKKRLERAIEEIPYKKPGHRPDTR